MGEQLAERCRCRRPDGTEVTVLVFYDPDRAPNCRAELTDGQEIEFFTRAEFFDPVRGERLEIIEQQRAADPDTGPETPP